MQLFSLLAGTSVAAGSNLHNQLESGDRYAKKCQKPLFHAEMFPPLGGTSISLSIRNAT
jgi:hypothetical protein